MTKYQQQDRGADNDYDRYLKGMDASMRQKVALTAAHLLCEGQIADMGMGSGTGSQALASLYPSLEVIGVDINQEMVDRAAERYPLPNLRFQQGDIAEVCFEDEYLEAILNSSVLHHVTSFNGYDHSAAERALRNQTQQLSCDGILITRDFVGPGAGTVWLDLPDDDEQAQGELGSTAALFCTFAREFRLLHSEQGFSYEALEGTSNCPIPAGWRRFEVARHLAVEFVLRKDYRRDWRLEVQEEYCYFTQQQFEQIYHSLGLRVLASTPIRNPWIVANRFVGKFQWYETNGERIDWPATNYLIVGQRVADEEGVSFTAHPCPAIGFLQASFWKKKMTGEVFDLVYRKGNTIDVLPWYEQDGNIFVLARRSYPRPILALGGDTINDSRRCTWVTEPLNVGQSDHPIGMVVEELLGRFLEIDVVDIKELAISSRHFPSSGGLLELFHSVQVEVEPVLVDKSLSAQSGFSTSGTLRAIEARQLLRAAQVGALPDARLELYVYELLQKKKKDIGAWIGGGLPFPEECELSLSSWTEITNVSKRRMFHRARSEESRQFIEIVAHRFNELDRHSQVLNSVVLESIQLEKVSDNTISCAVLSQIDGQIVLGIDIDDRPVSQCFIGHSNLPIAPAWRLPKNISDTAKMQRAEDFIRGKLKQEYGINSGEMLPLGGRYHPAPGLTPEVVHPYAVFCTAVHPAQNSLRWVPLLQLLELQTEILDGHLRLVLLRAAHAFGLG